MKTSISFCLLLLSLWANGQTIQPRPSDAEKFYAEVMKSSRPQVRNYILTTGKSLRFQHIDVDSLKAAIPKKIGRLGSNDVEAIAMLVVMQASKSSQEDLKAEIGRGRSTNGQKQKQPQASHVTSGQSAQFKATSFKHDSIITARERKDKKAPKDDMSELQSQQLQTMMDNKSQTELTISNIMKKISDSQDAIIKNLK